MSLKLQLLNQAIYIQVDDFTSSDESPGLDLPDGLLQFRTNLLELLVDVCRLLHPTAFVNKLFFGGLPSSNVSMPLSEIEAKLFALNVKTYGSLMYKPDGR